MKRILVFCIAAALAGCASLAPPQLGPAREPLVARQGDIWVRLGWSACGALPGWRAGDSQIQGKGYKLCWREFSDPVPHYMVVFEDGDTTRITVEMFRPESARPSPEGGDPGSPRGTRL